MLRNDAYNEKIDVFAFGYIFLELVLGDCTHTKTHYAGLHCAISKMLGGQGWRPPVPDAVCASEPGLVAIIRDCVLDDMNARPSFRDIKMRFEACKNAAGELTEAMLHPAKVTAPPLLDRLSPSGARARRGSMFAIWSRPSAAARGTRGSLHVHIVG